MQMAMTTATATNMATMATIMFRALWTEVYNMQHACLDAAEMQEYLVDEA